MTAKIIKLVDFLLALTAFLIGFVILVVLYTGLSEFQFYGVLLQRWNLAYLIILLVVVLILRKALKLKTFFSILDLHPSLLLFCTVLIVYLSNGATISAGDTRGARYLPLSILRQGDFYMDEFRYLFSDQIPHFLRFVNQHYVSDYPVGAPLPVLPLYILTALGPVSPDNTLIIELEKLSGALLVSFSVVMMYRVLLFYTSPRLSFVLALVYGLCTSNLSVAAQGAWQHGPAQLALLCALYSLLRGRDQPRWIPISGFFLMFSVVCRPTNVLLVIPIGVYVLLLHRKQALAFILCGLPPVLFQIWYSITYFNDPFRTQFSILHSWTTPFWIGASGILFSTGRGLFFYSPVFLFSIIGMIQIWRRQKRDYLMIALSIGAILVLLLYSKWQTWWGGELYGPRIISDINPILTLLLVPVVGLFTKQRIWRTLFIVAVLWSFYTHAVGAFLYDPRWFVRNKVHPIPERFWLWSDNPVFSHTKLLFKPEVED